jgi:hypothetical protein
VAEAVRPGLRPAALVWAFVLALTVTPHVRAALDPPPGTRFPGFFYFDDDQYLYLSYVQQAEAGSFLFKNKLLLEDHPGTLINLEWWLVGRLSALLGRRPILAYWAFGALASFALVAGADRWLRACGLPEPHRLPALLLVTLGGGAGGLGWLGGWLAYPDALDLTTGLFPFLELLANPHFVAGTALLLWSLWALFRASSAAGHARAALLGSITGLVRPYDLVLLVGIRTGAVLLGHPRPEWPARLVPLLLLAPVAFYDYWVFYAQPTFATWYAVYVFPALLPFAWALGPAVLLAVTALFHRSREAALVRARLHLLVWLALGAAVIAVHPVTFSLQFLAGIGLPLLALGALGLARWPPAATFAAIPAMASSSVLALLLITSRSPRGYVPSERLEAALALRATCRPGQLALTPPDIGLYVGGLTACHAYVSHSAAPGFPRREAAARSFYGDASAAERALLLDQLCVAHVALPGDAGERPASWLGEATPFRRVAQVGRDASRIGLYSREGGCRSGSRRGPPVGAAARGDAGLSR